MAEIHDITPLEGTDPKLFSRFMARVNVTETCWLWTGSHDLDGYGTLARQGRPWRAHRISYEVFVGPIADGLYVCHACDNPPCVRPDHLWLGTNIDNMADKHSKGREAKGERNGTHTHPERVARGDRHSSRTHPERMARGDAHGSRTHPERLLRGDLHPARLRPERLARGAANGSAKLTEDDVRAIRTLRSAGQTFAAIAKRFGVTRPLVTKIVRRALWKHVD